MNQRTAYGPDFAIQPPEESFAAVFTLAAPMYLYYVAHECWPTNARQLQDIAREFDVPFDMSTYSRLDMQELNDGRLRVRFHLAPPSQEEGEFTLSRPDVDKDQDSTSQTPIML